MLGTCASIVGMTNLHKRLALSAVLLVVVGGVALLLAVDDGPTVRLSTASAGSGPCMFDPSDRTYKNCAHPSMGKCHHYTTTCEPACMFDPSDQTHKRCAHPSMGQCHHYTTTCEPACMYDPSDGTYKNCAHPSMGKCHHYTTTCEP